MYSILLSKFPSLKSERKIEFVRDSQLFKRMESPGVVSRVCNTVCRDESVTHAYTVIHITMARTQ
jgi:hypothetical protein